MTTHTITHSQRIVAPAEVLWDLTTDVERWPTLFPTVTRAERHQDGPMAVGHTATIKQPGQGPRVWRVTDATPPRRFAWTASFGRMTMNAIHEITPVGPGGADNTLVIELSGRGAGLFNLLLGRRLRKVLVTENAGFAAAAERRAAERTTLL